MANKQNQAAGSQGNPGPGHYGHGAQSGSDPAEGQRIGQQQQYIELPEHQGVMIDYMPPRGGMRNEVGDIDAEREGDDSQSTEAGDEPVPGHMGGGLAGG